MRLAGHLLAVAASILVAPVALALDGDAEAGRRKTVTCNGCHAQATIQSVPNLAGQRATYIAAALRAYQEGKRAHATMRDVAKPYSDRELRNFAAYYAQLPLAPEIEPGGAGAPVAAASCEGCHGSGGRSPIDPDSPVLAGQKPAYLKAVLQEYRDGARKHAVMQGQAAQLTDADIETLSAYFGQVKGLTAK